METHTSVFDDAGKLLGFRVIRETYGKYWHGEPGWEWVADHPPEPRGIIEGIYVYRREWFIPAKESNAESP
jgi:hypothetical protein